MFLFIQCALCLKLNETCTDENRDYNCGDPLVCLNGTCQFCATTDQCHKYDPHFYCRFNKKYQQNICNYEPLLHPWDTRLIIGMICVFIAGIFVSGAGIGGGGLFVPILILVVEFPSEYSIPTSKALIFGGSLAVTIFNLRKRHPFYDRPLINYNVACCIEPISWLGTILGVIFNSVIPAWLLYIVQFILLSYTAYSTLMKGIKDQRKAKALKENPDSMESNLISNTPGQYSGPAYSKKILILLGVIWAIFLVVAFLRGGDGADSIIGIEFCSTWYWVLTFAPFPIYALINWWMYTIARNYPIVGKDADISAKTAFVLMMSGFIAGIAAGFLGIGGGMIKGPMMLKLDIEAEEMAATSTFMILLTSSATSIQYIAEGVMPVAEFAIFSAVGFVSFLIGVIFLRWLVKKMGNRSLFLYFLAAVIAVSAVMMTVVGVKEIIFIKKNGGSMGFKSFCD
ncbi:sulfite exporter TauE/safE family protein [Histomonas meleagridis]|uniref:sulfite exporter TauE/safE family protein n=1 Tax=Histomonas meleagridis TaxID=135588 RepID=UPI00355AC7DC|nr:sulfite exporter TauE/safE family protein [Histomonas meleagridis]KAH0796614.1 sulfite exporter TauE/safE family protein [Histomonas meleagridis]